MTDEDFVDKMFTVIIFLLLMCVSFIFGIGIGNQRMCNQALERGYAQYRTDNGIWTWKCDLEKEKIDVVE